jgi:putative membrane protein
MSQEPFDATAIKRPHPSLLTYYILVSLATGPGAPFAFLPLWFRYMTLEYKFDDQGVSMSWGLLFRREVYLTYRRIQDIHLTRNFIERWMGLSKISLQTASGKSSAEMTVEGVLESEQLRDFLYSKMRGAKNRDLHEDRPSGDPSRIPSETNSITCRSDRATKALEEIRDALQKLVSRGSAHS